MSDEYRSAEPYRSGYYDARYRQPIWRRRGDHPIVNRTRLRVLRREVPTGRLLDVGCGEGYFLSRAKRYYECWGIDISEEGVEIARRNSALDSINVHSAAEPLDFDRGFFDLITAFDVVEHLATPADFLREVARTLRPGGVFLLSTPNPASIGALLKHDSSHVYTDRTHVSIKPPSEWRAAVIDAGFGVVRDGTDGLWDWPYLPVVPKLLQRALFAGTSQVLGAVDIMYPWSRGENYLCLARRK